MEHSNSSFISSTFGQREVGPTATRTLKIMEKLNLGK